VKQSIRRGLILGFAMGFITILFGGWVPTVLAVIAGTLLGFMAPTNNRLTLKDRMIRTGTSALIASLIIALAGQIFDGGFLFSQGLADAAVLSDHPTELANAAALLAVILGPLSAIGMIWIQGRRDRKLIQRLNFIVLLAFLVIFPFVDQAVRLNWLSSFIFAEIYVLLALGLNIVVGYAGLLDLGYAAFFAIGAYTTGLLSSPASPFGVHVNFWLLIWIAAGMAAIFGLLLGAPTLGLRGDYLAIVTLGFGEIVPVAFQWLIHITIKEPFTCWIIPAFQSLFGAQPTTQCITLLDQYNLTYGVKGINPIDSPVLPILTPTDQGIVLILKIAIMVIVIGLIAFFFRRGQLRNQIAKTSNRNATIGAIIALVIAVIVFIPIPRLGDPAVANPVNFVLDTVQPGPFRSDNPTSWYFLIMGLCALTIFLIRRLKDSRVGRAWMAIREDELAANQMGINLVRTKLMAFAMGATFAGFAGAFYGAYVSGIFPNVFDFSASVIVLCAVVLGGLGNITGVIFGALIILVNDRLFLVAFQTLLNGLQIHVLLPSTSDPVMQKFIRANLDPTIYRYMLLGLVLVLVMAIRPEGLLPSRERAEELHAAEEDKIEEIEAKMKPSAHEESV
jgi:ABC-type branched-subunit amino acid transport system permease subunit